MAKADVVHMVVGHSLRHRPVFAKSSEETARVDLHDGQTVLEVREIATFERVEGQSKVAGRDGREQGDWKTIPASRRNNSHDFDKGTKSRIEFNSYQLR